LCSESELGAFGAGRSYSAGNGRFGPYLGRNDVEDFRVIIRYFGMRGRRFDPHKIPKCLFIGRKS
jgi:hypothetical protein